MKIILAMIVITLANGCTTLRPVEMSPEQLQERIVSGGIIEVGDSVRVFTDDGESHEFTVTAISDDQIQGNDVAVPIENIIALESREFSGGKTVALAGGSLALGLVIAAVAVAGLSF
jgi:hypothetical protein